MLLFAMLNTWYDQNQNLKKYTTCALFLKYPAATADADAAYDII